MRLHNRKLLGAKIALLYWQPDVTQKMMRFSCHFLNDIKQLAVPDIPMAISRAEYSVLIFVAVGL